MTRTRRAPGLDRVKTAGPAPAGGSAAGTGPGTGRTGRRRFRCDACGEVLEPGSHWTTRTCSCGRLTLSGGPRRPRVSWRASPGTGWSELDPAPEADDDETPPDAGQPSPEGRLRG